MTTVLLVPGAWSLGNTATVEAALGGSQAMLTALGDNSAPVRVPVVYNDWDEAWGYLDAANKIVAALKKLPSSEKVVVKAHSFGAVGVTQLLRNPSSIPTNPANITFVNIANSCRLDNGLCGILGMYGGAGPVSTQFKTYDIARQFDKWADYPNVTGNANYWKAVANVNAGDLTSGQGELGGVPNNIHNSYQAVRLDDPAAARTVIGDVTFSLHQTTKMPNAEGLTLAQIESAYSRVVPAPAW